MPRDEYVAAAERWTLTEMGDCFIWTHTNGYEVHYTKGRGEDELRECLDWMAHLAEKPWIDIFDIRYLARAMMRTTRGE